MGAESLVVRLLKLDGINLFLTPRHKRNSIHLTLQKVIFFSAITRLFRITQSHASLFVSSNEGWINASEDEFSCTPGETFKRDCNTCHCSSDGKSAACTAMGCFTIAQTSTETSTEAVTTEATTTEGFVESNNHVCTPNDIKLEVDMHFVISFPINSERFNPLSKDCNRCRCAANGIGWFCTRRACPPKEKRAVISPGNSCIPGDYWNDGCNNCFCSGLLFALACPRKIRK